MSGVPLLADLEGKRVVVVGGGNVAAAKITQFADSGALVEVIAPEAIAGITEAASEGRLQWHARRYRRGDLAGALLAIAATNEPLTNDDVAADADTQGILCVRVDGGGSAALLANLRRGDFLVAVSTGGRAPALARWVREELETRYGREYGELVELLGELRDSADVQARLTGRSSGEKAAAWRSILDTDILTLLRTGQRDRAREVASSCLSSS